MPAAPLRRSALALALCLAAACKKTPPPVDFQSHAPPRDAAPAADAPAPPADAGPAFRARLGEDIPGDGRTLTVNNRTVPAPPGQRFTHRIAWDYDHDGTDESVFVARAFDNGEAAGLSLIRPSHDQAVIATVEGPEPEDRTCGRARFRQTSPRSLVVEWGCPEQRDDGTDAGPRGVFRAESVLMGPIERELGFRARAGVLRASIPDTAPTLSLEGVDTDGDGVDELVCHVAAGRPGAPPGAQARVVFFLRNNVFVRDTSEPGASVRAFIAAQRRRAANRRTAAAALAAMDDLHRLRRALCADTVLARFKLAGVVGVRCPSDIFDGAAEVMLRAYVSLGELPAAWAMTRPESAHAFGVVPFARVRALLEGATPLERGATATIGGIVLPAADRVPALRFPAAYWEDPRDPQRVILPGERAQRVQRADWSAAPAEDLFAAGVAPLFPTDLARTTRLMGFAWTRRGLDAVFCPAGDAPCATAWEARPGAVPAGSTVRTLPLLPPEDVPLGENPGTYAQACAGDDVRALGWGADGLVVTVRGLVWRIAPDGGVTRLVAGEPWRGRFPAGQAITEDGAVVTLPAPEGIWLYQGTAWRRLAPEALRDRLPLLRDVAPSADGRTLVLRFEDNHLGWCSARPRGADLSRPPPNAGIPRQGEIVMVLGYPASGKSSWTAEHLPRHTRVNRDLEGGALVDLLPKVTEALDAGRDVALDNTYATPESRRPVIDLAHARGATVRCVARRLHQDAQRNAVTRMVRKHGRLLSPNELRKASKADPNTFAPAVVFAYRKQFVAPALAEGFHAVDRVRFTRAPYDARYTNRALLLDFDGTLRRTRSGEKYPRTPDDLEILPGRAEALRAWRDAGYRLLGVSNQGDVARGKLTEADARACFDRTVQLLGVDIEVQFCPHSPAPITCWCRKPMPGFGVDFIERYKLDPAQTVMVGDMTTDETFAKRCGVRYEDAERFFGGMQPPR
ncbi:MAG: HAD-IIIA family hydrolase [Polyangiales bacterium]